MQLPWKELKTLRVKNEKIFAVTTGGDRHEIAANELTEFFKTWKHHSPDVAKKAAFDYFNEEKFVHKLNLFLVLFLAGGISTIFLSDGFQTLRCNYLLEKVEQTKIASAEITKIKKNRRGNIVWDLAFTTAEGKALTGRRQIVNPDASIHDPGKFPSKATVIYSTEDNSCFDVSTRLNENVLPRAQRWFTTEFTLGFGGFFALVCLALCPWLVRRIREERPNKDVVENLYHTL